MKWSHSNYGAMSSEQRHSPANEEDEETAVLHSLSSLIRRQLVDSGTVRSDNNVAVGTEQYFSGILKFVVQRVLQDAAAGTSVAYCDEDDASTVASRGDGKSVGAKRPRIGPKDIMKAIAANVEENTVQPKTGESMPQKNPQSSTDTPPRKSPKTDNAAKPLHAHASEKTTEELFEETAQAGNVDTTCFYNKFILESNITSEANVAEKALKQCGLDIGLSVNFLGLSDSEELCNYWSRWPQRASLTYLYDVASRSKYSMDWLISATHDGMVCAKTDVYVGLAQLVYAFNENFISKDEFKLVKQRLLEARNTKCSFHPQCKIASSVGARRRKELQRILTNLRDPSISPDKEDGQKPKWQKLQERIKPHCQGTTLTNEDIPLLFIDIAPETKTGTENTTSKFLAQYIEAVDTSTVSSILEELSNGRQIFVFQPWARCEKALSLTQYQDTLHAMIAACRFRTVPAIPKVSFHRAYPFEKECGQPIIAYFTHDDVRAAHRCLVKGRRAWQEHIQSKTTSMQNEEKTSTTSILNVVIKLDNISLPGVDTLSTASQSLLPLSKEGRRITMRHLSDMWCHVHFFTNGDLVR